MKKHFTALALCLLFLPMASAGENYRYEMLEDILYHPEQIQIKVKSALQKYFKNPEELTVEFFPTKKSDLAKGYFSRIDVKLKKTKIKVLEIEEGNFSLIGIRLDLAKLYAQNLIRIRSIEDNELYFLITEEALNNAIQEKKLPIGNPNLTIRPGLLEFHANFRTLFIKSKVDTKGRLEVHNLTEIYFHPDRLKLNSIPIPGFLKRTISHKINPIIDLKDFSFIKSLSEIRLQNKQIEIIAEKSHSLPTEPEQ
jgi:hypothetical protein